MTVLYMPLFRSCATLKQLMQLHAYLLLTGLHRDPQVSTKLIDSYFHMSSFRSSVHVFDNFSDPDCFMWGVFIKCNVLSQLFEESINQYSKMFCNSNIQIGSFIFPPVLRACAGSRDIRMATMVHGQIIKSGFEVDTVIGTSLVAMYGGLTGINDARKVFDFMPMRDVVSWSSIISTYIDNGEASIALEMFRLLSLQSVELDSVLMLTVGRACSKVGFLKLARSVHSHVVRKQINTCGSLRSTLINMYCKCDDVISAEAMFLNMEDHDPASWATMIACYHEHGCHREAVRIFVMMLLECCKVKPDAVMLMFALRSCAALGWFREGKFLHGYQLRTGVSSPLEDDCTEPALIELYAKCGELRHCEAILNSGGDKNAVSWNMLMSVCAQRGLVKKAINIFIQMQGRGLIADSFGLSTCLTACGDGGFLKLGRQMHAHTIKSVPLDEFVQNSLIDMYSKCDTMDSACLIFRNIKEKSIVTWNCMITGFLYNGNSLEAICLFDHMYVDNHLEMNAVTYLSVIQACARLGHLKKGKWVHHKLITRSSVIGDTYVDTALIDMYARCGDLGTSKLIFHRMSERNNVSWSVMIAGYGMHGLVDAAISLFSQMVVNHGINPNSIAFVNVLSACSHGGRLEEGKFYFKLMREFGIDPETEHWACMVDLLSRAGHLNEACALMDLMPLMANSASTWGALLNGLCIHSRMDMIQLIGKDLDLRNDDSGYYTSISNIYAQGGNWDQFRKVRSLMRCVCLKKVPGYSMMNNS